jgi:hypothetical protein
MDEVDVLADELALFAVDEEMALHPELLSQKESLLKRKSGQIKEELLSAKVKFEDNLVLATTLLQHWFKQLPSDEKELFKRESEKVVEISKRPDFEERWTDPLIEPSLTYQAILGLSDAFMQSIFHEAERLQKAGSHLEALALFQFISLLNAYYFPSLLGSGFSHLKLGHLEEAQNLFDIALVMASDEPKCYYFSALCNFLRKEKYNAKTFCDAGLEFAHKQHNADWVHQLEKLKSLIDHMP